MRLVLRKAGPYIGPRGGKYADPQHKIPWREGARTGAIGVDEKKVRKVVDQLLESTPKNQHGVAPQVKTASVSLRVQDRQGREFPVTVRLLPGAAEPGSVRGVDGKHSVSVYRRDGELHPEHEVWLKIENHAWDVDDLSKKLRDVAAHEIAHAMDPTVSNRAIKRAKAQIQGDVERARAKKYNSLKEYLNDPVEVTATIQQIARDVLDRKVVEEIKSDPEWMRPETLLSYSARWGLVGDQYNEKNTRRVLRAVASLREAIINDEIEAIDKSMYKAGPYIGPRGGKYADPQHKIPWKEGSTSKMSADKLHGIAKEMFAGTDVDVHSAREMGDGWLSVSLKTPSSKSTKEAAAKLKGKLRDMGFAALRSANHHEVRIGSGGGRSGLLEGTRIDVRVAPHLTQADVDKAVASRKEKQKEANKAARKFADEQTKKFHELLSSPTPTDRDELRRKVQTLNAHAHSVRRAANAAHEHWKGADRKKLDSEFRKESQKLQKLVEPLERQLRDMSKSLNKAYKLHGRRKYAGMDISIENRKGSIRRWYDPHGRETGSTKMYHDYGYIRRTEGTDGEHIDVYIGPYDDAPMAYIVDQAKKPRDDQPNKKWTEFDEQKVMLGFRSMAEAKSAYMRQYNDPRFFLRMHAMPIEEFKREAMESREHGRAIAPKPKMVIGRPS